MKPAPLPFNAGTAQLCLYRYLARGTAAEKAAARTELVKRNEYSAEQLSETRKNRPRLRVGSGSWGWEGKS